MLNGDWILMPDFRDEGFVLGARRHGENGVILSLFTKEHGRHLGLIRSKTLPLTASFVDAKWHARLTEHLGNYVCEVTNPLSASFMDDKKRLAALSSLCSLLDETLPEREPLPDFYLSLTGFLNQLPQEDWLVHYVRFEALLLSVLGFGLDLTKCAGGGDANDLYFVSPKTAKGVSRQMGQPYADKLLLLPGFLWKDVPASPTDIQNGLSLTGYFLAQHTRLPIIRQSLFYPS